MAATTPPVPKSARMVLVVAFLAVTTMAGCAGAPGEARPEGQEPETTSPASPSTTLERPPGMTVTWKSSLDWRNGTVYLSGASREYYWDEFSVEGCTEFNTFEMDHKTVIPPMPHQPVKAMDHILYCTSPGSVTHLASKQVVVGW